MKGSGVLGLSIAMIRVFAKGAWRMLRNLALVALIAAIVPSNAAVSAQKLPSSGYEAAPLVSGSASIQGDWREDKPGLRRRISVADLPEPFATPFAENSPTVVKIRAGARPQVPAGFSVEPFLSGLTGPRLMRRAPNGDIFLSQGTSGRIMVMRTADGADKPEKVEVFAHGLRSPFGIAFYPPGPQPKWVYVAGAEAVVRFPYVDGDMVARGVSEEVVKLPIEIGGHWTRDLMISPDGSRMYVSIGARGNAGEEETMPALSADERASFISGHALGAAWGQEHNRAGIMVFDTQGRDGRLFATGLRNCVGFALQPRSGDLWCSVNERDAAGDDLPADFVTHIQDGQFYGWPWFYNGANEDPHHRGTRPDLAGKVAVPDVLLQPHSVPLGMTFYERGQGGAAAFPTEYEGDAFVALHGSWNRAKRVGYKIVRIKFDHGKARGEVQDFLTGFVIDSTEVSGRPAGIVVARDGALLVSEDGNGTIWRVAWKGPK